MKKILLLFTLLSFVGCGALKKTSNSTIVTETNISNEEKSSNRVELHVDTTRTIEGTVLITEIEFEPSTAHDNNNTPQNNIIELSGIGKFPMGALKSFKQTGISSKKEDKGVSSEINESEIESMELINQDSSEINNEEIKPAPDPYRWRYLFFALLVVLIILVYLKRTPIIKWLKKVFLFFRL